MKPRKRDYRKILRAYTGTCGCGMTRTALISDGRTRRVNRFCVCCGIMMHLYRNRDLDRPLVLPANLIPK